MNLTKISKRYQPSNGSEGDWFTEEFCWQCAHCDPDPEGEKQCEILMRTLIYSVSDDKYPEEWVYDENKEPTCTAHKPWDWKENGEPPPPPDPAQLNIFIS